MYDVGHCVIDRFQNLGGVKITPVWLLDAKVRKARRLSALTTDAAGKLDVLGHDSHTLGVDSAQVGVLK